MKNVTELNHPLIEHMLSILRDKNTGTKEFRELVKEISRVLCYEAMRDIKLEKIEIETPITKMKTGRLNEDKYAFVPILRAGMGMLDGIINIIPNAKIGHIGMYRDEETHEPHEYYCKLPSPIEERLIVVTDPMLATGGSAVAAIQMLKDKGVKKIIMMCIIAAPEGVKAITDAHPDVDIYIGALDEKLNEKKYIVPGIGDAGDRIFGTK